MTATETLKRLKERLDRNEEALKPEDRQVIDGLVEELEKEIFELEYDEAVHEAHREEIHDAMRLVDVVVHHETSAESDTTVREKLREALEISVDRMSANHPVLAGILNRLGRVF